MRAGLFLLLSSVVGKDCIFFCLGLAVSGCCYCLVLLEGEALLAVVLLKLEAGKLVVVLSLGVHHQWTGSWQDVVCWIVFAREWSCHHLEGGAHWVLSWKGSLVGVELSFAGVYGCGLECRDSL